MDAGFQDESPAGRSFPVLQQSRSGFYRSVVLAGLLIFFSLLANGGGWHPEGLGMLGGSVFLGSVLLWIFWPMSIFLHDRELVVKRGWQKLRIGYDRFRKGEIRLRPARRKVALTVCLAYADAVDERKSRLLAFPVKSFRAEDISELVETLWRSAPQLEWDDDLLAYHRLVGREHVVSPEENSDGND